MPLLAATFLKLLEDLEPQLAMHLCSIGCPPLAIAVPWLSTAFADVLPVQEVLLLWDRVIGFDSLMILPLAAVGIFAWRSQLLQACVATCDVLELLEDLEEVQIVPLLQAVLFLSARG
jgi:hypothetical protein